MAGMSGRRLLIGIVFMGIAVPAILFFLLGLERWTQLFTVAVTCFLAWGLADLTGDILARPRLENRTPVSAIRDLEIVQPGGDDALQNREPGEGREPGASS